LQKRSETSNKKLRKGGSPNIEKKKAQKTWKKKGFHVAKKKLEVGNGKIAKKNVDRSNAPTFKKQGKEDSPKEGVSCVHRTTRGPTTRSPKPHGKK